MPDEVALAPERQRLLVCFALGRRDCALEVGCVQEIVLLPEITPVPCVPDFVEGVVNLRGRILPVVDLARRLGLPAEPRGRRTRIVVGRIGGALAGLIVDHVAGVERLAIQDPDPEAQLLGLDGICGVARRGDRPVIVLDLARIFRRKEAEALSSTVMP